MELEQLIIAGIRRATREVFSTMLGVDLEPGEVAIEAGHPDAHDGVVSLIGLVGPGVGTGLVSCPLEAACRICSHMLTMQATTVDEEVLDAVAELTNMIVGGVKSGLEPHLGPLCLSSPMVVCGSNFRIRSARTADWIVLRFPREGSQLVVKMCVAREAKPYSIFHPPGHTCALEV